MQRASLIALMLVLSSATFGLVSAQQPGDEGTTTWYVHNFKTPEGAGSILNFEPYTDEADQTATCTGCAGPNPFKITSASEEGLASEYTGPGKAGRAFLSIKAWNNGPAPQTKVVVNVKADGATIATGTLTQQVVAATVKFEIPLTVSAASLPAGAVMSMEIIISESACGCYNPMAYPRGVSKDNPMGFTLPFTGAAVGGAPSILLQAANASANVGETGTIEIGIRNNGTADLNVTLNATGDLPITFANESLATIAGNTTNTTATFDLRDATPGTTYNITVHASVDGIEVANVTISVLATATPSSDLGSTSVAGTSNETASAKGDDSGAGVPGFGVLYVGVAALMVGLARRRRA